MRSRLLGWGGACRAWSRAARKKGVAVNLHRPRLPVNKTEVETSACQLCVSGLETVMSRAKVLASSPLRIPKAVQRLETWVSHRHKP